MLIRWSDENPTWATTGVSENVVDATWMALVDAARLTLLRFAEESDADVVLLQVEREPDDAVLELEHLQRDGVLEPVHPGDAVADRQNRPDLGEVGLDVVVLDPFLENRRDLFGA